MGIIFHRTLKCGNCGYVYKGKSGGHIISNGEHYGISQYYCNTCHSVMDLEYYLSLKTNTEKYFYPDGKEVSYEIKRNEDEELNPEDEIEKTVDELKERPPFCQECGKHLFKFDIDNNEAVYCPQCGHKSLEQKEIHVVICID